MTRFLLLAIALSAINPVTDWIVDFQFKQAHESTGYSSDDRGGMTRLLQRELDRKPAKPKQRMSAGEQAAAMEYLWGDGQ